MSLLTGKALSHRANITASKSYSTQTDFRFDMKTFMELRNAQAVALAYDGSNPKPPMFCYLKHLLQRSKQILFCAGCRRGTVMNGFEMILPFLKPIEHLILDETISEVMVNGPSHVFIERDGFIEEVRGLSLGEKSLMIAVKNIARRLGDDICEAKPILDSRLPDGSRVAYWLNKDLRVVEVAPNSKPRTLLTVTANGEYSYNMAWSSDSTGIVVGVNGGGGGAGESGEQQSVLPGGSGGWHVRDRLRHGRQRAGAVVAGGAAGHWHLHAVRALQQRLPGRVPAPRHHRCSPRANGV